MHAQFRDKAARRNQKFREFARSAC